MVYDCSGNAFSGAAAIPWLLMILTIYEWPEDKESDVATLAPKFRICRKMSPFFMRLRNKRRKADHPKLADA